MPIALNTCKSFPVKEATWPSSNTPLFVAVWIISIILFSPWLTALKSITSPRPITPLRFNISSISLPVTSKPDDSNPGKEGMVDGANTYTLSGKSKQASTKLLTPLIPMTFAIS